MQPLYLGALTASPEEPINHTSVMVDDQDKALQFSMEPTEMGAVTVAVFDDTCGNMIQIAQG